MTLQHIVRFERGYDCIRFECVSGSPGCHPGSGGSHGRHGLAIRFLAAGDAGAVQFVVNTGWVPQRVTPSSIFMRHVDDWGGYTLPTDLGYHAKEPQYEGQTEVSADCEFTGGPCFYDGSGLDAMDGMYALVNGGDEALWAFLDAYYEHVFNDAPYPTPAEYPHPERGGNA